MGSSSYQSISLVRQLKTVSVSPHLNGKFVFKVEEVEKMNLGIFFKLIYMKFRNVCPVIVTLYSSKLMVVFFK